MLGTLRHAHRRNTQGVARLQTVVGADPAAVDPHFPAAQDPVDVALGNAFQQLSQVVVDALTSRIFTHFMPGCEIFT